MTAMARLTKGARCALGKNPFRLPMAVFVACALLFAVGCGSAGNNTSSTESSDQAAEATADGANDSDSSAQSDQQDSNQDDSADEASREADDSTDPTSDGSQSDSDSSTSDSSQSESDGSISVADLTQTEREARLADLSQKLGVVSDYRTEFDHGPKDAQYQKYIVLHDTEVNSSPESIVNSWDNSDNGVAAHFVIGKDGSVVQCVSLDRIAHHAGFGNAGHNEEFDVEDESHDDKVGTTSIGTSYPDYGMNSYSVGIELVHAGSSGEGYPEAQLQTLDNLIAYIDTYFGNKSQIIDHKAWRTSNSDTSPEFAGYLASYQAKRTHK